MKKILIGVLIIMGSFITTHSTVSADSIDSAKIYPARELWEAFQSNPQKALETFNGKRITFEGVVLSSAPSVYATPMVTLSDKPGGQKYVACILPRADFAKLIDYKKGSTHRFSGVCRGQTFDGTMVLFKESRASD